MSKARPLPELHTVLLHGYDDEMEQILVGTKPLSRKEIDQHVRAALKEMDSEELGLGDAEDDGRWFRAVVAKFCARTGYQAPDESLMVRCNVEAEYWDEVERRDDFDEDPDD